MIESRYKIEYVLPDEEVKKTSPFRVMWYLLLIPLIAIVVAAITYDFSIKDLSRDSMVLVEKAKVHIFNLGDPEETKRLQRNSAVLESQSSSTNVLSKIIKKKSESTSPEVASSTKVIQEKIETANLTNEQEKQLKEIQKQITENSALTTKLNTLSEQFLLEQVKNQELNSQLAEQEKDRLELEEQLNQMLEKSAENIISLEELDTQNIKAVSAILETEKIIESNDAVLVEQIEVNDTSEANKTAKAEDKVQLSDTDKIIQAMTDITTDSKPKTDKESDTETASEVTESDIPETQLKNEVISTQEKDSDEKNEVVKIKTENSKADEVEVSKTATSKTVTITPVLTVEEKTSEKEETKLEKTTAVEVIKTTEAKLSTPIDSELEDQPKQLEISQDKPKANIEATNKQPSAVDAIIAAMQQPQAKNEASSSSNVTDEKQQLVEQGKVSVQQ